MATSTVRQARRPVRPSQALARAAEAVAGRAYLYDHPDSFLEGVRELLRALDEPSLVAPTAAGRRRR
jgi:hypothetical protein